MDRSNKIWFSMLFAIGFIFVLAGLVLRVPLAFLGPPWSWPPSGVHQHLYSLPLIGIGFFFLAMSLSAAGGESRRALNYCFALGVVSLCVTIAVSSVILIDMLLYELTVVASFGLIFGSVFASLCKSFR